MWRYTHQYLPQCRKKLNMHTTTYENWHVLCWLSAIKGFVTYRLFTRSSLSLSGSLMRFGNGGGTKMSTSSSSDTKSMRGGGGLKFFAMLNLSRVSWLKSNGKWGYFTHAFLITRLTSVIMRYVLGSIRKPGTEVLNHNALKLSRPLSKQASRIWPQ